MLLFGYGFIAQDIGLQNKAGPEKRQAVALRVGANQSIINRCKIDAFQDILHAHSNRQFYHESFLTDIVDFIFGNAGVVLKVMKLLVRVTVGLVLLQLLRLLPRPCWFGLGFWSVYGAQCSHITAHTIRDSFDQVSFLVSICFFLLVFFCEEVYDASLVALFVGDCAYDK